MIRANARSIIAFAAAAGVTGCTQELPGSYALQQQQQSFSSTQQISTKIDLLWVIDNSSSMDTIQQKLRAGYASFAQQYMQPTWDIRLAVITTDTYLANSAFSTYLNTQIPGTVGSTSPYISSRLASFVNPSTNPTLVNLSTGVFTNGLMFKDLVPPWAEGFARLLPGLHDGPITTLCYEGMPYFLNGVANCAVRDNQNAYTGTAGCLDPTGAETGESQCVNTIENNTVRSGQAIISTMPPSGTPGNSAWVTQITNNFIINASTGSSGYGSERGMGSVLQLLSDNETTPTAFFRPGSLRGIVFVSDEDDQTMQIPSTLPTGFTPWSYYGCDQSGLSANNPPVSGVDRVAGPNGFCCSPTTGNGCYFGAYGTSCPVKTVDGYNYTLSVCVDQTKLMPVTTVKSTLDSFFQNLDKNPTGNPNYFIASIVGMTASDIQTLQAQHNIDDAAAGELKQVAADVGQRYIDLGNAVGNGSFAMSVTDTDYTPILNSIGLAIIQQEGTFTLARAPTSSEEMIVYVLHADGSTTTIPASDYTINGKQITINNVNTVLSFSSTDQIIINYQPTTLY